MTAAVSERVVLVTMAGVDRARQWATMLASADERRLLVVAVTDAPAAAAAMVVAGEASVVLAAFDGPQLYGIEPAVAAAGGRVEYCRAPHRIRSDDACRLAARLAAYGVDSAIIAEVLGTGDVAGGAADFRTRRPVRYGGS